MTTVGVHQGSPTTSVSDANGATKAQCNCHTDCVVIKSQYTEMGKAKSQYPL